LVLKKLRKALRNDPQPMEDEAKFEHCQQCQGDCPLINGCC